MKAVVIREFGAPEVMRLEDVTEPEATPGEIVIKVHSVSVNRTLDCVVRAGKYPVTILMPHVLGVDPAGDVVAVGSGVSRFKIGDRVATISIIRCGQCKQCARGLEANCLASQHIGLQRWGGYAEYVAVPERNAQRDWLWIAAYNILDQAQPYSAWRDSCGLQAKPTCYAAYPSQERLQPYSLLAVKSRHLEYAKTYKEHKQCVCGWHAQEDTVRWDNA